MEWNRYLADERLMMFHPYIAKAVGLNEAIFLQQLHYWLNRKPHMIEEKGWVYNPYKAWQEQFCFLSESTIKRTIKNLVDKGIVLTANYNKAKFDRTLWYSIDYDKLDEMINEVKMGYPLVQIDTMQLSNLTSPIPSTNTINKEYKENVSSDTAISKEQLEKEYIDDFTILYREYPRKVGKKGAFKAYKSWIEGKDLLGVKTKYTGEQMYDAICKYRDECLRDKREMKYIKQADTFFRNINDYIEE